MTFRGALTQRVTQGGILHDQPPKPAANAGYRSRVFFDDFTALSTIDIGNTQTGNFNWYLSQWFNHGQVAMNPASLSISNSILTIADPNGRALVSAFDTSPPVPNQYHGNVFEGGGYFEAKFKFDPSLGGGPFAFGMSIEHIADNASVGLGQWTGQPSGYGHFIEVDFFETLASSTTTYNASIHDWGGVYINNNYTQNIVNGASNIIDIGMSDFTQFHLYGCLWVPQVGNTPGRIQRFFDNVLVQSIYYKGPAGSPPLPTDSPSEYSPSLIGQAARTYSIIDQHHLALTLFGPSTCPMHIDWFAVWK